MKRIFATILAVAMLLSMCVFASAADNEVAYAVEGGNIYFDPTTGTITDADSGVTAADIPAEIDGVAVTSIGDNAFTSIDDSYVPALTSVTIPSSVTSIGRLAFNGCRSLTSVTISEGVTSIGEMAFGNCDFTSIEIPSSVTSLSHGAFLGCDLLTEIVVDSRNPNYCSVDGVLFDKTTSQLILYPCSRAGTSYVVPSGVKDIGDGAFSGCNFLRSVTIPEGVTSIGTQAFGDCHSLRSVTIPSSVTSIGFKAFDSSLTDVYYGGSKEEWNAIRTGDSFWGSRSGISDSATIHYNSPMPEPTPVEPTEPTETADLAIANTQSVLVDGESVTFETYALEVEGGVTNYIKLRDLAYVLNGTAAQFEVSWDGAVNILDGQSYTENGSEMSTPFEGDRAYRPTDAVTKVDGVETPFDAICLKDDDGGEYNYYKLRDLGKALGFDVSWNNAEQYIFIETDQPYTDD